MNIAFLSSLNPNDQNNWSGTLYSLYTSLQKKHRVIWVCETVFAEVWEFHKANFKNNETFFPENYALLFGKSFSDLLKKECYDVIICRDYFFSAYLVSDVPLIYIGDTTFHLFNQYMSWQDESLAKLAEQLESLAIQKADKIIYCSEWAKQSAMQDYNADAKKIEVVEFGANIIENIPIPDNVSPINAPCNLLFIGRNWNMKGGNKVLEIYHNLKGRGFQCTLTIIGSEPPMSLPNDPNIEIYPFIDKTNSNDRLKFHEILTRSHFLILPTRFDCFGIAFCEACAYGIPSLGTNVGGVSQVIKEGENGFLFNIDASSLEYADKIEETFNNHTTYFELMKTARKDFEERLNWDIWLDKSNKIIEQLASEHQPDFYLPVYVINMKERVERKQHIIKEFDNKEEFELNWVEASVHPIGAVGLWNSMIKIIKMAKEKGDDIIVICEDDHYFTENYSPKLLFKEVTEAYIQGADVLTGGIGGFGQAIPEGYHRYKVDWFWCTQFIVVYNRFFDKMLDYSFQDTDTADGVISKLATNKMVIFPFISEQRDFGYSDVTQSNMEQQGKIREHFARANKRMEFVSQSNMQSNIPKNYF